MEVEEIQERVAFVFQKKCDSVFKGRLKPSLLTSAEMFRFAPTLFLNAVINTDVSRWYI